MRVLRSAAGTRRSRRAGAVALSVAVATASGLVVAPAASAGTDQFWTGYLPDDVAAWWSQRHTLSGVNTVPNDSGNYCVTSQRANSSTTNYPTQAQIHDTDSYFHILASGGTPAFMPSPAPGTDGGLDASGYQCGTGYFNRAYDQTSYRRGVAYKYQFAGNGDVNAFQNW